MRIARPGSAASMSQLSSAAGGADPTCPECGSMLTGQLPVGCHHVEEGTVPGRGCRTFSRVAEGLGTWRVQRFGGLRVFPVDVPVRSGATVVVTLGTGIAAIGIR